LRDFKYIAYALAGAVVPRPWREILTVKGLETVLVFLVYLRAVKRLESSAVRELPYDISGIESRKIHAPGSDGSGINKQEA